MTSLPRPVTPVLAIVVLAALAKTFPAAQQRPVRDVTAPPIGTAVVVGSVVSTSDGTPVRRALVNLGSAERINSLAALTDDKGRFVFEALPAGRYSLSVSKPGWVTTYYGAARPGRGPGMPLAIADGQAMTGLSVDLTRGAVVAGRITNEFGQPIAGVRPMVLEYRSVGGQRALTPAFGGGTFVQTNDLGEFRLWGLAAGEYVVGATAMNAAQAGFRVVSPEEIQWARAVGASGRNPSPPRTTAATYAPMYYPGTTDPAQAATVKLSAGEERTGIDFAIRPVPVARVSGVVTRLDGGAVITPQITLRRLQESVAVSPLAEQPPRASFDRSGRFSFPAVLPGRYQLSVRAASQPPGPAPRPAPGAPPAPIVRQLDLWASTEITVQGDDLDALSLTLEPGLTLSGRIVFDATTLEPPADLSQVRVQLRPAETLPGMPISNMYMGMATTGAAFNILGVAPGEYLLSAFFPGATSSGPRWSIKSVRIGGQEMFDRPITIAGGAGVGDIVLTMTDRTTELTGVLQDQLGRPAPDYQVFVFPVDKSFWRPMSARLRPPTRPGSDGRYRVLGLPPGEYFVAALGDLGETDFLDAAFLEQVAAAALKVTIGEGEKRVLDLRLQGARRPQAPPLRFLRQPDLAGPRRTP